MVAGFSFTQQPEPPGGGDVAVVSSLGAAGLAEFLGNDRQVGEIRALRVGISEIGW
ncbi:MAG: hypothetical protein P4M00_16725 [Azospirillaceae bacterium]|nr:hypothetical protein [Azospirillaceae bacterium]